MSKMTVVYVTDKAPKTYSKSIFLAGPSPREEMDETWRTEALRILEELGYDGVVFVPLTSTANWLGDKTGQIKWETIHLNMADMIVFWVPRDMKDFPGFTTNVEYGTWFASCKIVYGRPDKTPKMDVLDYHAKTHGVQIHTALFETLRAALHELGDGASRTEGERYVPLHVWKQPWFQGWYEGVKREGKQLWGAVVRYTEAFIHSSHKIVNTCLIDVDTYHGVRPIVCQRNTLCFMRHAGLTAMKASGEWTDELALADEYKPSGTGYLWNGVSM